MVNRLLHELRAYAEPSETTTATASTAAIVPHALRDGNRRWLKNQAASRTTATALTRMCAYIKFQWTCDVPV